MGSVIYHDFGRTTRVTLTKKQLGAHHSIRRSRRWIEERMREGMPSQMYGNRRIYDLDECLTWLENRRSGGDPQSNEAPPVDPPDADGTDEAEPDQPPDLVA